MKESLPKSGRWFSWMESAHAMLREWWASRMILEWYLGMDVPDPDECVMGKFKDLRAGKGGLKLVHAVLSRSNSENCHILLACNRPLWDWYTVQVTELKTAHDAVDYAVHMSTQWCHDEQFFKLAKAPSHDHDGIQVFRMLAELRPNGQMMRVGCPAKSLAMSLVSWARGHLPYQSTLPHRCGMRRLCVGLSLMMQSVKHFR